MKIAEFTGTDDLEEQIKFIMTEREDRPDIDELKDQWDVKKHRVITDKTFLPDKEIKDTKGNFLRWKYVNRIATPIQKNIVSKAVVFGFGNPVEMNSNAEEGSPEEQVLEIMKKILKDNKSPSFDRRIARECYRAAEVAEYWYYSKSEKPHNDYGFPCNYKIRCLMMTPWKGEKLYPHFNEYNDMKLFSRAFVSGTEGNKKEYLDVWTSDEYIRYVKGDASWEPDTEDQGEEIIPVKLDLSLTIGKIPVSFAEQEDAEWADVQNDAERLELLFSRHAEINDYHAGPKTFVKGNLLSAPQAGEANSIINGDADSDVKILSWANSPESIKLEIETRLGNIFKFTQTPDVSFDNVKALNQISGVMLKMLFMDAHIKVLEKQEIWDEYYSRRYSILKSYIGKLLNPKLAEAADNLEVTPKFSPYMIDDMKAKIEMLMTANGNKPLISHRSSVIDAKLTADTDADWDIIEGQMQEEKETDLFNPVNA